MSDATASNPAETHRYVEVAAGGIDHRGSVKLVEQVNSYGATEQYATYGRATIELLTWLQTHRNENNRPTTRGFDGAIWTPYLHLDFDARGDPEKALGWARQTYERLMALSVPVDAPRLFFSGAKGFHCELPAALFGGFAPSTELHRQLKPAAKLILGDIPFDPSVYNKLRLWRLENTRNAKGRFKIRLAPEELLILDMGKILALALAPRPYPQADSDADDWLAVPELVSIWHQAREEAIKPASSGPAAALGDNERDRITVAAIGASWPRTDEQGTRPVRHDYLLAIGGYLARQTSTEHVARLLKGGAEASGDHDRDWSEEIDRIAASSSAKVAAGSPVTGLPRLAEQFPGLAKTIGALWEVPTIWLDGPSPRAAAGTHRQPLTIPATAWKQAEPTGCTGRVDPSAAESGNGYEATNGTFGTDSQQNESAGTWPAPDAIEDALTAPVLPLQLFPAEIAAVAEDGAERIRCPVDYIAWTLLVSVAGLMGRGVGLRPRQYDDWTERGALWVVCIGLPSWLKSPGIEFGTRPLRRQQTRDREVFTGAYAAWKDTVAQIKAETPKGKPSDLPPEPVMRRCISTDSTVEKLADLLLPEVSRGLTIHRDELAGLIYDLNKYRNGSDRQFYLQAFSGGLYAVDRVTRGSKYIEDLLLNIVGGIQPEVAREIFATGPDDGLAARFTAVWPSGPPVWETVDRLPNKGARDALDAICDRLADANWADMLYVDDFRPTPFCRLTDDAREAFTCWETDLMTSLQAGSYADRHEGRAGKYRGVAVRLALAFHLINWGAGRVVDPRGVPASTMRNVLELMTRYVLPMEARVFAEYSVTPAITGGRKIAHWLRAEQRQSFTVREIRRHHWAGLTEEQDVLAALDWLVTARWIHDVVRDKNRVGRPPVAFLVNPRIYGN